MIYTQHNDGGCFKLTIEYINYEYDCYNYIIWADDFDECLQHGLEKRKELENNEQYISNFRIQDDSK